MCAWEAISAVLCAVLVCCAVQEDTPAVLPDGGGAPSEQTLRECAIQKAQGTEWTQALEGDRLCRDTAHHGGVSNALPLAPQIMAVASVDAPPVYPCLAGFGSLDTSALTGEVRQVLDSLVASINEGDDISPLMAAGMEYQAMFFMDDLSRHCDFAIPRAPETISVGDEIASRQRLAPLVDSPTGLSMARNDGSSITALYGQPFFGDDGSIIVKIRLTCGGQTADAEAALTKEITAAKETSDAASTGTDETETAPASENDGNAVQYKIEQLRLL